MMTNTVYKFSPVLIKYYLEKERLHYLVDRDGDFMVQFVDDDLPELELKFYFCAQGDKKEIFLIRCYCNKRFKKCDWSKVIMFCNDWNCRTRMPKAYLRVEDYKKSTAGDVVLETNLDLEKGIHIDLLSHIAQVFITCSYHFWKVCTKNNFNVPSV